MKIELSIIQAFPDELFKTYWVKWCDTFLTSGIVVARDQLPTYNIKNIDGVLEITKFAGHGGNTQVLKTTQEGVTPMQQLSNAFHQSLGNMYPNVLQIDDANIRDKFTRIQAEQVGNKVVLKKTKPQHYFDFLSESGIANTRVHGLETQDKHFVLTASPSIGINTNIASYQDYAATDQATDQVTNTNVDNTDSNTAVVPEVKPKTEDGNTHNVDPDGELPLASDDLLSEEIDFNKTTLQSFAADNDVTNTLLSDMLRDLDEQKATTGFNNAETALNNVKQILIDTRDKFAKYSKKDITKETAKKHGVYMSAVNNMEMANRYTKIIDSFETQLDTDGNVKFIGYGNLIKMKFDSVGFSSLVEMDEDNESDSNDESKASNPENWADNRNFKVDPEKSASARVRRLFYDVPVKDANGKIEVNQLGQPKYHQPGAVFNYLIDQLVDVHQDFIMYELRDMSASNSIALDVLTKLDKLALTNSDVVNNFITVMRKQQTNFITVKYEFAKNDTSLPIIRILHSNRTGIADLTVDSWKESFYDKMIQSGNATNTDEGFVINEEFGLKIANRFNSLPDDKFKESFIALLNEIGIQFTSQAYDKLHKDFTYKRNQFVKRFGSNSTEKEWRPFVKMAFGPIFNTALAKKKDPFKDQLPAINNLSFYQSKFESDATSRMFKNGANDNVYGYVSPNHMSNTINDLLSNPEKVRMMMLDKFKNKSSILNTISKYHELMAKEELTTNEKKQLDVLSNEIKSIGLFY